MDKHSNLRSIEEIVEVIEHWKIGDILKKSVNNDLTSHKKFKAYWKLLKEQLYLYEQKNSNCIFEKKRQYYAARQIVRDYSIIAKSIED